MMGVADLFHTPSWRIKRQIGPAGGGKHWPPPYPPATAIEPILRSSNFNWSYLRWILANGAGFWMDAHQMLLDVSIAPSYIKFDLNGFLIFFNGGIQHPLVKKIIWPCWKQIISSYLQAKLLFLRAPTEMGRNQLKITFERFLYFVFHFYIKIFLSSSRFCSFS